MPFVFFLSHNRATHLEESNNSDISTHELVEVFLSGDSGCRRASLLFQPVDYVTSSSSTTIFHIFAVLEELDGWISTYTKLLSETALYSGIYFAQFDGRAFFSQLLCSLGILRGKCFTMSTPWSILYLNLLCYMKFISMDLLTS